jgi:hypothetical protein
MQKNSGYIWYYSQNSIYIYIGYLVRKNNTKRVAGTTRSVLWTKKRNNKNIHIYSAYHMQNVNAFFIKIGKLLEIFNVYCNFECLKDQQG